jgi:16S rRNA (guanine527-N7)-methyltransferase
VSQWDRARDNKDQPAKPANTANKEYRVDGSEKPKKPGAGTGEPVIHWRIDEWFPEMDEAARKKLKALHEELLKFNKTINLISPKTTGQADAVHFADCILACKMILANASIDEIYDFGSGNGFPGLIFAIMSPKAKVHLIELDQRKAEFLKHCIALLKVTNADVMIKAVESLPPGSVKFAIARGFASITKVLLATRKIFVKGGRMYHLKGEEWASEVASIPTQLCSFWAPALVGDYRLPIGEFRFSIVKTEKIAD